MKFDQKKIKTFKATVLKHYHAHGRHDLPWRKTSDPYKILVSEIMLQQTQVERVKEYYKKFIQKFPTVQTLARAPFKKVLKVWSGLGYNRRALMLHRCAQEIVKKHHGKVPDEIEVLKILPGIGPYTAGAVRAFAFNIPAVVLDTNIRSVYIHSFFQYSETKISDIELTPIIEKTIDRQNPRKWYSVLMDYGAWLKTQGENPSRRSAHHVKQSKFEGSHRQVRGAVLKALNQRTLSVHELKNKLGYKVENLNKALQELNGEGFIKKVKGEYKVA